MLTEWGRKWGVSEVALAELRVLMGVVVEAGSPVPVVTGDTGSEARQQSLVRIDAAQSGVWLTRNNVGVLIDKSDRPVRFGLANESPAQNKIMKSADLIGMRPVVITQAHVGHTIAQFVSREVKREGWRYTGDEHEVAQRNWLNFVVAKGGDAAFCCGPGSFSK